MKKLIIGLVLLLAGSNLWAKYVYTPVFDAHWGRHMYGGPSVGGYCGQGAGSCAFLPFRLAGGGSPEQPGAMLGYDADADASSIAFSMAWLDNDLSKRSFKDGIFYQEGDVIINDPEVVAGLNETRGINVRQYLLRKGEYPYRIDGKGPLDGGDYILVEEISLAPYCEGDVVIAGYYAEPLTLSSNLITSNGATTIVTGAGVILEASSVIYLVPGFTTVPGTIFTARIAAGCAYDAGKYTARQAAGKAPAATAAAIPATAFALYPNPTSGLVTVRHPTGLPLLQVYDVAGALRLAVKASAAGKTELNISHLPAGIYYVRAQGQPPQKLVKQ